MSNEIIVRGGTISEEEFAKHPREVTTGGQVDGLSVFVGEVKKMQNAHEVWAVAKGYPGKTITAVSMSVAKKRYPGIQLKKNVLPNLPNHYLLSGIGISDAVDLFTKEVRPYEK